MHSGRPSPGAQHCQTNMDSGRSTTPQGRRSSSLRRIYRRDSNMSNASFVSEVEMAQDEVFAGPMSESVPTSASSFTYQRPRQRQGSISSFTYFQEAADVPEWSDEEAVVDESDEETQYANGNEVHEADLEAGDASSFRRKSSGRFRADQPLLTRKDSTKSDTMELDDGGNFSQKLYIVTEDLTMVIAGFQTSKMGFAIYLTLCLMTGGLAYLLFRWLPRWHMKLMASPAPLRSCTFVVVEVSSCLNRKWATSPAKGKIQNQWGEFTVHHVSSEPYGHPLSTVFGTTEKEALNGYNDDDDPTLENLRFLDYRYMRLLYHPYEDKFVLNNSWWDPQWTGAKELRVGLDLEDRDIRDQVFGKNIIEIQAKSVLQLLLDEVRPPLTDLTRRRSP
jgi:cation-transporting P-type ATPase 13A2